MEQIKRYGIFLIGLFVASLGVAFSTKAGLGTSPVASVPYSVSLVNHALSFGWWLNVLSLIQITVQVALLRKRCIRPLTCPTAANGACWRRAETAGKSAWMWKK